MGKKGQALKKKAAEEAAAKEAAEKATKEAAVKTSPNREASPAHKPAGYSGYPSIARPS